MMPTPTSPTAPTTGPNRADPWKEDGNVVLAAGEKHFRVHRSILSAQSEVFGDMFEVCAHSNKAEKEKEKEKEEELIEACPVIHLHDAAADVQMMLKALYDRSYPLPYYKKVPISVVFAFLRLGDKYAISGLVKEAKARLSSPIDPKSSQAGSLSLPTVLFPGVTGGDPHNFQIMNLLQEMKLMAPLPLAMYHCTITCPLTYIVDGYRFNGSLCSLSPANLRSFIRMKDMLEKFRVQLAKSLHAPLTCITPSCTQNIHRLWLEDVTVPAPFDPWTSEWDRLFCKKCGDTLKARREREMSSAWNQLPTVCGFGSWEDVAKSGDFPSPIVHAHQL